MRHSRHPALSCAITLPLVLLIFFSMYALKAAKTDLSTSPLGFQSGRYTPSFTLHTSTASKAVQLSPTELMERPHQTSASQIPKLFHQSWSTTTLPAKFEQWSLSCREMNPDFEYGCCGQTEIIDDWWRDTRRNFWSSMIGLKSEIYRADAVRYLYMFVFGG